MARIRIQMNLRISPLQPFPRTPIPLLDLEGDIVTDLSRRYRLHRQGQLLLRIS
jgi:hypothetical protein